MGSRTNDILINDNAVNQHVTGGGAVDADTNFSWTTMTSVLSGFIGFSCFIQVTVVSVHSEIRDECIYGARAVY